jgi:hypothetical protein
MTSRRLFIQGVTGLALISPARLDIWEGISPTITPLMELAWNAARVELPAIEGDAYWGRTDEKDHG